MKTIKTLTLLYLAFLLQFEAKAQLDSLIIEKYYIADSKDATYSNPVFNVNAPVEEGSITYRIYIDLQQGQKLAGIYGDQDHPIIINSTENFFNFPDLNLGSSFGYNIQSGLFLTIGTIALDSWLTLGYATKDHMGILKEEDTDISSVLGDSNSDGILTNTDAEMGIALTTKDGLTESTPSSFADAGLSVQTDPIFGQITANKSFSSTSFDLRNLTGTGIAGPTDKNRILIAQLTTKGELEFEFNLIVLDENNNEIRYVANGDIINEEKNERFSKFLSYPPKCGCTDPYFIEFDPAAICDDGSCRDSIKFGCNDPEACNYDPDVNDKYEHIQELCCYGPDDCQNRNINIVCPNFEVPELQANDFTETLKNANGELIINISPNPVINILNVSFSKSPSHYVIYNSYGSAIVKNKLNNSTDIFSHQINVSELNSGFYILHLYIDNKAYIRKFVKNRY